MHLDLAIDQVDDPVVVDARLGIQRRLGAAVPLERRIRKREWGNSLPSPLGIARTFDGMDLGLAVTADA